MPQGPSGGPMLFKGCADAVLITSQTAVAATGNTQAAGSWVDGQRPPNGFVFELNVTSAAAAGGDTLDVYVQTRFNQLATSWTDVVHFTQILGSGGVKRYLTKITAALTQTEFEVGTALGAAAVRQLMGDGWCCRWVIAGSTPAFSFTVNMVPM